MNCTAANRPPPRRRGRKHRQVTPRATPTAAPYVRTQLPPLRLLDEEGLELIERNADRILDEIGMEFRDDAETLEVFRQAGARITGERVRFDPGFCRSIVQATAPRTFIQHARNPNRSVQIGGDAQLFAPSFGPPFVHDMERGRRYATLADFQDLTRLHYMLDAVHHSGGVVCEPVDIPVPLRHLHMAHAHLTLSDKPFMGAVTAPSRAQDTIAMAEIAFGVEHVAEHCVLYSVINTNAPLVLDATMLGALKTYARAGQAVVVSPFIIAGAMSPVAIAATLAQALAEVLAGTCLIQLLRPGAPAVFGTFFSPASMASGAPTFGTPEGTLFQICAKALADRLGLPFHSVGALTSAKVPDAQAGYESQAQLLGACLAGVNFIIHATGCLEGLLTTGYEKVVMDAERCAALVRLQQGVDLSEASQAWDAFQEVEPGGHFLGSAHTLAHFENAFWRSDLSDDGTFEQWSAEGATWQHERATKRWQELLAQYEPSILNDAVRQTLEEFIDRRTKELNAPRCDQ